MCVFLAILSSIPKEGEQSVSPSSRRNVGILVLFISPFTGYAVVLSPQAFLVSCLPISFVVVVVSLDG